MGFQRLLLDHLRWHHWKTWWRKYHGI